MENDLQHHGIKGQRWGVRRFQNSNGSLTPAGKKRYGDNNASRDSLNTKRLKKAISTGNKDVASLRKAGYTKEADAVEGVVKKNTAKLEKAQAKSKSLNDNIKKYRKTYDEAEKSQDIADKKWNEVKSDYINTGRNRVERIINNVKYNR